MPTQLLRFLFGFSRVSDILHHEVIGSISPPGGALIRERHPSRSSPVQGHLTGHSRIDAPPSVPLLFKPKEGGHYPLYRDISANKNQATATTLLYNTVRIIPNFSNSLD
jgi:hypothetical protein